MLPLLALCVVVDAAKPAAAARPTLSGAELVRDSADGQVKIHYTLSGADAVPASDADPANGIPDAVDWIEEGAARMVSASVGEDGWHPLVADDGRGGDDRLDVYVRIIDANGYAHADAAAGGTAAWIEVNPARASMSRESFASIAAHEVHHALEVAQAGSFVAAWIAEASATYAQYVLFDDTVLALGRQVLWHLRLTGAARALDDAGHGDLFEYAGLVWVKFLVDRAGGDRRVLGRLWRLMGEERGWVAGHARFVAEAWGAASLDEAVLEFAMWNWFACSRSDGRHYDAATAGCTTTSTVAAQAATAGASGDSGAIALRGAAYVAVAPDCATQALRATVRPRAAARVALLGQAGGAAQLAEAPAGVETTLVLDGWNEARGAVLVGAGVGAGDGGFAWRVEGSGARTAGAPAAIAVDPAAAAALVVGDTLALRAVRAGGTCDDGAAVDGATWRTSDARVVTVDEHGVVSARGAGRAEVVATLGALSSPAVPISVAEAPDSGCDVGRAVGLRSSLGSTLVWVLLLLYRRCGVK